MRIVFFGTADFGLPTLEALARANRHQLVGAVTGPDKPRGRGLQSAPTPVGEWLAGHAALPVLKPERLSDPEFVKSLRSLDADAFVVVAYRILPEDVITIPRWAFNLHASLLPAYRGAAPVQRAIMAGETTTGVTTFLLQRKVDSGDIIAQRDTSIGAEETAGDLFDRLSRLGAELVISTFELLVKGDFKPTPQDHSKASPAPKLTDADLRLNPAGESKTLINQVRALAPRPGVVAEFRGGLVKIFSLRAVSNASLQGSPGEVVALNANLGPLIAVGDGILAVASIQPAGKKVLTGAEFVRGYHPEVGECFTTAHS